ncbi:MAG: carboxymuconolactone decarboxylase family protein [Candidatus Eisenbacteria bacterium]|uniref:Carboxymuconolactone decarboxylase family protein n=1 Tax=Eiseniibacteriota bacterium TaxID=2212470 RepID=A0A956SBE7_UNCEI|nr:carboxymuconolactone decarboxylase family protein [Candidatus Eisenbacteria bacterium]MCB9462210.1 carboxymuconolactone decarboxylase family protein [Candidatus Eisenbacteria bacterium]
MKRESASKKSPTGRSASKKTKGAASGKTTKSAKKSAAKSAAKTAEKPAKKAEKPSGKIAKAAAKKAPAKNSTSAATASVKAKAPSAKKSGAKTASAKPSVAKKTAAKKTAPAAKPQATKTSSAQTPAKKSATKGSTKRAGRTAKGRDALSHRLADESAASASPVRANLAKPPTKEAISPTLDADKFHNALRGPVRDSGLPRRIAHGAILPALLSEGRTEQLQEQLDWALEDRVPAFYLAESLLQSYLFVGFPRTINALARLHEVTRSRRRGLGLAADPLHVPSEIPSLDRILGGPGDFGAALKGRRIRLAEGPPMHLESPGEGPGSFERYAREWWRRGSELCRAVYGSQYTRLRENLGRIHPELADWMVFEGYGKVLSRPVITPRERELWIIPLLLVQNVPDQLYSHLRGAKNLGVPMSRIRAVLWLASAIAGPARFAEANEMLDEIERREAAQREDRLRNVY